MVAAAIRTIFAQPTADTVAAQVDTVAATLERQFPAVAGLLLEAKADVTAFATFPHAHWHKIWSTNPLERLNREVKRRTDVVGIFPSTDALLRLSACVLIEAHDEWQDGDRRYLSEESMALLNPPPATACSPEPASSNHSRNRRRPRHSRPQGRGTRGELHHAWGRSQEGSLDGDRTAFAGAKPRPGACRPSPSPAQAAARVAPAR